MTALPMGLFAMDRLEPEERECRAYLAGDLALAAFIGDATDAEDELAELQEQHDELAARHQALQADINTAMDWISSDKCHTLERCKELVKRFKARLAAAPK